MINVHGSIYSNSHKLLYKLILQSGASQGGLGPSISIYCGWRWNAEDFFLLLEMEMNTVFGQTNVYTCTEV